MADDQCPLCAGPLEVRKASPCHECGGDPDSLARFEAGDQTYHSVRMFQGLELILCEGCMLSFGGHDPSFFGKQNAYSIGFEHMDILKEIQSPTARDDMFCPQCGYRLRFLRFVKDARAGATS